MMNCFRCGNGTTVLDSRDVGESVRRRRQCRVCRTRFTTVELLEGKTLTVDETLLCQIHQLNIRFLQLQVAFDTILGETKQLNPHK